MALVRVGFQSPQFLARKRRRRYFKSIALIILALVVIALLTFLFRFEGIRIDRFYVEGAVAVPAEHVEAAAREALSGNYLYLLPKNNILLYPQGRLRGHLLNTFKRFESVDTSLADLYSLNITVVERKPHALWCGMGPEESGPCYLMDKDAFIFAEAPDFSGGVFFKYFGSVAALDPIGSQFLPVGEFKTVEFFLSSLERAGFPAKGLAILPQGVHEAYLEKGGRLIWTDKEAYGSILANLEALTQSESFKSSIVSGVVRIDYIDLRYGNKIFYRPAH